MDAKTEQTTEDSANKVMVEPPKNTQVADAKTEQTTPDSAIMGQQKDQVAPDSHL